MDESYKLSLFYNKVEARGISAVFLFFYGSKQCHQSDYLWCLLWLLIESYKIWLGRGFKAVPEYYLIN